MTTSTGQLQQQAISRGTTLKKIFDLQEPEVIAKYNKQRPTMKENKTQSPWHAFTMPFLFLLLLLLFFLSCFAVFCFVFFFGPNDALYLTLTN